MSNIRAVVGLDVGTTKIACFVGIRNEHGKIEILSMGQTESLGVSRGVVENIERTVQSIKKAVQEAQDGLEGYEDITFSGVNVGVAGQHIRSLQHRGMVTRDSVEDEIAQKDIDMLIEDMYKMLMPPGEKIITVIPQEYIIDNQQGIKDPIGHAGVRLEANFHIITGNVGACMNIQKCVRKAGFDVKEIILEPMASAEACLSEEEKEAGVVLVDIGGGTTDIAIFHDGIIQHTAIIPFGGNVITEDIKEGCAIMRRQAEQLKLKFGTALASESQENDIVCIPGLRGRDPKEISVRNLSSIIQARMTEIIELVDYEINNSGFKRKLIGGIVVTGGGSQLKHITQLFEYVTGLDTRIGYPTEHIVQSESVTNLASPMYATGVGLVLQGFKTLDLSAEVEPFGKESKTVKSHSKRIRGNFFETILEKGKSWFVEED